MKIDTVNPWYTAEDKIVLKATHAHGTTHSLTDVDRLADKRCGEVLWRQIYDLCALIVRGDEGQRHSATVWKIKCINWIPTVLWLRNSDGNVINAMSHNLNWMYELYPLSLTVSFSITNNNMAVPIMRSFPGWELLVQGIGWMMRTWANGCSWIL